MGCCGGVWLWSSVINYAPLLILPKIMQSKCPCAATDVAVEVAKYWACKISIDTKQLFFVSILILQATWEQQLFRRQGWRSGQSIGCCAACLIPAMRLLGSNPSKYHDDFANSILVSHHSHQ